MSSDKSAKPLAKRTSRFVLDPAVFSASIKRRREELGISIRGLAQQADVAQSTIFRVERGDCHVQFDTLMRILNVLDMSPDELLKGPDGREPHIAAHEYRLIEMLRSADTQRVLVSLAALLKKATK